ncbi:unnamed protein product [Mucor circinelloides]
MAMPTKKSMKAVFDCSADEPGELSFKEGDILVDVEESGEEGWYIGRIQHTSETGLFPYNYVVELPSQKKEEPLSKFPPIDAFEAAMSPSSAKTSFSKSNTSNWAISPPTIAAKPKLSSTAPSSSSNSNVGLGIRVYGSNNNNNNNNNTFEKPQLKPIGSIKSMDATSPTRSRSYSTSAVLNTSEKEPMQTEKTLRPSQLLNGKGTKSALELALSKGSPKSLPSSSVKSSSNNALSTSMGGSSTGGIALPGLSNTKLNNTHDTVEEEEDGFQMVKPSQLRSRQQQQVTPIRPIVSQSSSFTSTPSWKKTPDTKVFTNVITASPSSLSSASSSPRPTSGSKLDAAPSTSTPMPRLPSRPVSTASRRSRNSRNSSSSLKSSPSASSRTTPTVTNANLPPVRETNEKSNPTPPILKPKPQMAAAAAATTTTAAHATTQPNLPPRPKLRSTSNPPPIQPKPAMSSIEILLSKNNTNKSESAVSATTTTPSKSTTPPPRNAATKPVLSSTNKKPTHLSSRPSLDGWQSLDNAKEDVNIKPSALLKNNRARSATNPVSSSTTPEWMSTLNKQPKPSIATAKPVHYERPTSPVAHPVSRSPAPMAAAVIEPASATTSAKKNPPPPPPSRPPKSQNNSKQRYEVLFDSIHDDGYVDGETAHFVWLKSRLSNEDLARIWKECDPDHKGLLDKHAFIDGMSKIDELLSLKQQQQAV